MLKREFKLKNSEEVKTVLKLGRKVRGNFLTLFVAAGTNTHCRAAVVIGRKVAGGAVRRNRVRRIIFSDLETRLAVWVNRPVSDMVVMVMNIPFDFAQGKSLDEKLLKTDLEKCFAG